MCTLWWHKTSIICPADKRPLPSSVLPLCLFLLDLLPPSNSSPKGETFSFLRSSDWSGYLMFLFLLCKNIVNASGRANLSYDLELSMAYDTSKAIKNTFFCVWQKLHLSPAISATARGARGHNLSFLTSLKLWFREQEPWIMNEMFAGSHFTQGKRCPP